MLRPHVWLFVVAAAFVGASAAGTVVTHRLWGWRLGTVALAGLTTLGIVAAIDLGMTQVRLSPGELSVRSLRSRRRLTRVEIARVTWAKGAGVAVELQAGGWVKLPELGRSSPTVAAQLRRWLNR